MSPPKPATEPSQLRVLLRRLRRLESSLRMAIKPLAPGPDRDNCLVWQLEEQVGHLQAELLDITRGILSLEQEEQSLLDQESALDKTCFDLSLQIRRLLSDRVGHSPMHGISSGIKLPKIHVPTFDGNVVNWSSFWQQFNMAIHSKAQLNDTEKLVYLRDALKGGPAKHVIEGLVQDAEYYEEAIGWLQICYN